MWRLGWSHPGLQRRDFEAEGSQGRGEECVLLEAVPSSPPVHELGLERLEIESDRAAETNVDVLERNRLEMPEVQLLQQRQRRLDRWSRSSGATVSFKDRDREARPGASAVAR